MNTFLIFLALYVYLGMFVWGSLSLSKMFTKTNPLVIVFVWPYYVYLALKNYKQ